MRCIDCHSSFLPLLPLLKHKQQLKAGKLLWLPSIEPTVLLHKQNICSPVTQRTKSITTSLVFDISTPAKSADPSVLFQASAALLFAYLIANFVIPAIMSKDLQLNETGEDQKANDDKPLEDEKESIPTTRTPSSQTKKRGFNSPKPR